MGYRTTWCRVALPLGSTADVLRVGEPLTTSRVSAPLNPDRQLGLRAAAAHTTIASRLWLRDHFLDVYAVFAH